jgi:hypothetical protein
MHADAVPHAPSPSLQFSRFVLRCEEKLIRHRHRSSSVKKILQLYAHQPTKRQTIISPSPSLHYNTDGRDRVWPFCETSIICGRHRSSSVRENIFYTKERKRNHASSHRRRLPRACASPTCIALLPSTRVGNRSRSTPWPCTYFHVLFPGYILLEHVNPRRGTSTERPYKVGSLSFLIQIIPNFFMNTFWA